jgi:hypothetical protein
MSSEDEIRKHMIERVAKLAQTIVETINKSLEATEIATYALTYLQQLYQAQLIRNYLNSDEGKQNPAKTVQILLEMIEDAKIIAFNDVKLLGKKQENEPEKDDVSQKYLS